MNADPEKKIIAQKIVNIILRIIRLLFSSISLTIELSSGTKNRCTSRRAPRRARRVSGMLGSAPVILLYFNFIFSLRA